MCSFIPCRPKQVSLFYLNHVCTHIRGWRFPGLAEDSRLQEGNLQQLRSERISRACDGGKVCPGKEKASYHTLTRLSAFYRLSVQLCSFSFRQEWETLKTVGSHVQQLLEWAVKSLCWCYCRSFILSVTWSRDHSMNRALCVTVNPNTFGRVHMCRTTSLTPPVPIMLGIWSQWHQLCLSHTSTNLRSPWVVHTFTPCLHRCVHIVRGWTAVAKCTSSCVSSEEKWGQQTIFQPEGDHALCCCDTAAS